MREHGCGHRYLVNVGGIVARPDDGHGAFLAQLRRRQAECFAHRPSGPRVVDGAQWQAGINGFGKILVCPDGIRTLDRVLPTCGPNGHQLHAGRDAARPHAIPLRRDDARAVRSVVMIVHRIGGIHAGHDVDPVASAPVRVLRHVAHDAVEVGMVVVHASVNHSNDVGGVRCADLVPVRRRDVETGKGRRLFLHHDFSGVAAAPLVAGQVGSGRAACIRARRSRRRRVRRIQPQCRSDLRRALIERRLIGVVQPLHVVRLGGQDARVVLQLAQEILG